MTEPVVVSDVDAVRLVELLTRKHQRIHPVVPRETIERIVGTTVADVLLVTEGALTVADFEPSIAVTPTPRRNTSAYWARMFGGRR